MNGDWQTVEIGSLCDGIFDGPHATPSKTECGPVFLGISSLNKGRIDLSEPEYISETDYVRWTRRVEPCEGDVVFSYETRLGEAAIIPQGLRCCLGRRMALMRPNTTRVNPRFLLYAFLGPDFQDTIRSRTIHGSTVDRIPLIEFPRFPIRLPTKPIQDRIADTLASLDDKIELNRRTNETLEAMARSLFRSWFVDFDPVRAKADGQKPQGMDAATAKLFPDSFEPSALGPIPKDWRVVTLGEFCSKITDGSHHSPPSVADGLPMASVKDMTNWGVTVDSCRHISSADFEQLVANGCSPQSGDVLLAKDGATCLETACEYQQDGRLVLLSSVALLRPTKPAHAPYLHLWLTSDATKSYLREGFVSGSAIPRVVLKDLRRAQLLYPTDKVLDAFNHAVQPLREMIRSNNSQSHTLAATRDALLPRLLSGEVRVGEVARP